MPSARQLQVTCKAAGKPGDMLSVGTEPLPLALGWGEVLVNVRAAPVRQPELPRVGPNVRAASPLLVAVLLVALGRPPLESCHRQGHRKSVTLYKPCYPGKR